MLFVQVCIHLFTYLCITCVMLSSKVRLQPPASRSPTHEFSVERRSLFVLHLCISVWQMHGSVLCESLCSFVMWVIFGVCSQSHVDVPEGMSQRRIYMTLCRRYSLPSWVIVYFFAIPSLPTVRYNHVFIDDALLYELYVYICIVHILSDTQIVTVAANILSDAVCCGG